MDSSGEGLCLRSCYYEVPRIHETKTPLLPFESSILLKQLHIKLLQGLWVFSICLDQALLSHAYKFIIELFPKQSAIIFNCSSTKMPPFR